LNYALKEADQLAHVGEVCEQNNVLFMMMKGNWSGSARKYNRWRSREVDSERLALGEIQNHFILSSLNIF
jgi:hypothetical protein